MFGKSKKFSGRIMLEDGDVSPETQKSVITAMFEAERNGQGYAAKMKPVYSDDPDDALKLKILGVRLWTIRPVTGFEVEASTPEGVDAFLTALSRSAFRGQAVQISASVSEDAYLIEDERNEVLTIEAE